MEKIKRFAKQHYLKNTYEQDKDNNIVYKVVDFADMALAKKTTELQVTPNIGRFSLKDLEEALYEGDYKVLRDISNTMYLKSGLYASLINYYATLMKNYFILVPKTNPKVKKNNILDEYEEVLDYVENFDFGVQLININIAILLNGIHYVYLQETTSGSNILRTLPIEYCRTKYLRDGRPLVEFNLKYFDSFQEEQDRMNYLNSFPKEISVGYKAYLSNSFNDSDGTPWLELDPSLSTSLKFFNSEKPLFISSILEILRLEKHRNIEDEKALQQLMKIVVQKYPIDKDGTLVFDPLEVRQLHANAVGMLRSGAGVDVLSTYAETDLLNVASDYQGTTNNILNAKNGIYEEAGISNNLLTPDGNSALSYAASKDESIMFSILSQIESFLNYRIKKKFEKNNNIGFRFTFLDISKNNYKEKINIYKEQTTLGYSKMLPAIAAGIPQSSLVNLITLEDPDHLNLLDLLIPPQTAYTQTAEGREQNVKKSKEVEPNLNGEKKMGRPVLPDSEKDPETIARINRGGTEE